MATTIQINEDTLGLLKMYKEQMKAQTYDEVIKKFMTINMGDYAKKFKGYLGKKIPREELLKGLRDKADRF